MCSEKKNQLLNLTFLLGFCINLLLDCTIIALGNIPCKLILYSIFIPSSCNNWAAFRHILLGRQFHCLWKYLVSRVPKAIFHGIQYRSLRQHYVFPQIMDALRCPDKRPIFRSLICLYYGGSTPHFVWVFWQLTHFFW